MPGGERRDDHPPEGEADERRPGDGLGIEQRGEVRNIVVEMVRGGRLPGLAVTAEVVAEQGEIIAERSDDVVPGLEVRAYTVKQGDMRAVALTLEVDGDAVARRDHGAAAGTVVSRKHGMTSRPNSSSDRIAKSCGRPKLAP